MDTAALSVSIYLLFAVPCALICAITCIRHRKYVRLGWADWLLAFLPWAIWIGLSVSGYRDKSLSNSVESVVLGVATGLIFFTRCWAARHTAKAQPRAALASLTASSLAAVAVWALVPALPE